MNFVEVLERRWHLPEYGVGAAPIHLADVIAFERVHEGFRQLISDLMFRVGHGGRDQWSVLASANEISIFRNGRLNEFVRLSEIKRIRAVSRDMATHDEIFLVFETDEKGYWVGEHFDGFDVLSDQMKLAFPLRIADWYEELSRTEPFSNSEVLVWER